MPRAKKPTSAKQFQEEIEKVFRDWSWSVRYFSDAASMVLTAKESEKFKTMRDRCETRASAFRVFMISMGWTTEEVVAIEEAAWKAGHEAAVRDHNTPQLRDWAEFLSQQIDLNCTKMDELRELNHQLRERRTALIEAQRQRELVLA